MNRPEMLTPLTNILPTAENSPEGIGVKVGLTLLTVGILLFLDSNRQRAMEAATRKTRLQSKAAMTVLAAGAGTLLYFGVWT